MSTFTLAISCLTISNFPWFMDLTFQVPVQYCFLQHWTLLLSPVTSTTGYCFCFGSIPSLFLELFLHWSPVSSILGTYRPGEFLFQYPIILPFHTVHGVLKARILTWFAIPFSSGPHSVRPLHHGPSVLGGPTQHGLVSLSETQLWSVIRLASFLWLWFQCACPLMPSRNTYCLTWVSLTLDKEYLFTAAPPDLECEVASLGSSVLKVPHNCTHLTL